MTTPLDSYRAQVETGDLRADATQESAMRVLEDLYAQVIALPVPGKTSVVARLLGRKTPATPAGGAYLYGPVGRGKTHMMDLFFATLPGNIKKRRVHFHRFMIETHDFLHRQRQQSGAAGVDNILPKYAADLARECQVLCFDEFHVVDVADAMILQRLFTALMNAGITVVLTSNWAPDHLYKGGLQRDLFLPFIELIKSRLAVVQVDGAHDYRLERLNGRAVYFWPLTRASDQEAQKMFDDLTGAPDPEPVTINVKGRTLSFAHTAKGVLRASFADLCEKALGAEDYLALAAQFHTLILDHVPKMNYDRRNEAKRLIILIDIWYERHRRLVVTAEAPPEKLYLMGDHAFEFERTISRLKEMQSEAYLSTCLSNDDTAVSCEDDVRSAQSV